MEDSCFRDLIGVLCLTATPCNLTGKTASPAISIGVYQIKKEGVILP